MDWYAGRPIGVGCLALAALTVLTGFDGGRVVVKVNDDPVLLRDVMQRMKQHQAQPGETGHGRSAPEAAEQALQQIIANRLVMQEAKASGIPWVTEQEFDKAFTPAHMTLPNLADRSFQEDWVVDVLRQRLTEKLMPKVTVTPQEIAAKFEEVRFSFQPQSAVVRWIVVPTEEQARGVIDQLHSDDAFAAQARSVSIEPVSAAGGGLVGSVRPDKIPAELARVVFNDTARPGIIRDPIEVKHPIPFYGPAGWYIVKIDSLVQQGDTSLERWRPVIESMLRAEKATRALEQTLATRRKQARIWKDRDWPTLLGEDARPKGADAREKSEPTPVQPTPAGKGDSR